MTRQSFCDGGTLVMHLGRQLDLSAYGQVCDEVKRLDGDVDQILLDLSDVDVVRDSGVAAVLALANLARVRDIRLILAGGRGEFRDRVQRLVPAALWVD